ncbi:MAG TPA: peptide-methionine (S)-S-oxide reductase MsrA [Acetobacteraceae bacterium]|nr:peptide-methionine (S)-S-oxide reductase MsrA [Acetobacteraceae bacterium]
MRSVGMAAIVAVGAGLVWVRTPAVAADARAVPAPAVDLAASQGPQSFVLSGGCFWGVQGVFEHVRGVQRAVSGYAGGSKTTANYETVSTGTTGHAESVQITYDPKQISFGHILQIFFSVVTDPTEVNRQGPDDGTQYRSDIFVTNPDQARVARAYIAQLDAAHVFDRKIATRVDELPGFYPAEAYHQDFLVLHPDYPYIVFNDAPKVGALKRVFPADFRATPALVGSGS